MGSDAFPPGERITYRADEGAHLSATVPLRGVIVGLVTFLLQLDESPRDGDQVRRARARDLNELIDLQ
jgi:hypothetical protein